MNYGCETDRLRFVIERDGLEGAIAFAKQTLAVYRESLSKSRKRGYAAKPHFASNNDYRMKFVQSCLAFRKFLRETKIAFDLLGVQPMTMPTGLVFALRNRYTDKNHE